MDDDRLSLAEPQLAVDLLCSLYHEGQGLVDRLSEPHSARAWLQERLGVWAGDFRDADLAAVTRLRDELRTLFTAVVDGTALPAQVVASLNIAAANAPATLTARWGPNDALYIERTVAADGIAIILGEVGRAALALLTDDLRERLRLCRAPRCVLFFLKDHPRQEWCSPSCGNRARVARHFARHRSNKSR